MSLQELEEAGLDALTHEPMEDGRAQDLWAGTWDRIERRSQRGRDRRILAGCLALTGLALAGWWAPGDGPPPASHLALASGAVPGAVSAGERAQRVAFADGSVVRVEEGARFIPTRNGATLFETEMTPGTVRFEVRPGGPRRWVVRAGPTTVEVLGTRFSVRWQPDRTEVRVERGRVAVSDPRMRPRRRVLGAGESVEIRDPVAVAAQGRPAPTVASRTEAPPEATRESAPSRPARARVESERPRWRELARAGEHREAYEVLGRSGLREETATGDAARLMLLADVARLSGHPAEAVAPLRRLLTAAPDDPQAPLAALLLGRILMDELSRPSQAREALLRARELGVPPALRADLERRLERLEPAE